MTLKISRFKNGEVNPSPPNFYIFFDNITKPVTAIAVPTRTNKSPTYLSATSIHPLPAGVLKHSFGFKKFNLLTLGVVCHKVSKQTY